MHNCCWFNHSVLLVATSSFIKTDITADIVSGTSGDSTSHLKSFAAIAVIVVAVVSAKSGESRALPGVLESEISV